MERDRKNWILVDAATSRANPSILVRDRERRTTSPYEGATVDESRLQTINRLNNRIQKRFVEQEFYSDYGIPKISPAIPDESSRVSNPYISQTDSQGEIEAVFEKRGPSKPKSPDRPRRIQRRAEEDIYVLQNEPIYSKMPAQISFDDVAVASTSNAQRQYDNQYYVNNDDLQADNFRDRRDRRRKTESATSGSLRVKRRFAPPPLNPSRHRVQPLPENTVYDHHQRDHRERIYSTSREAREYTRRTRHPQYRLPEEYRRYPPDYNINVDYPLNQAYSAGLGQQAPLYRDEGYLREPIYVRGAGYSPRRAAAYQHTLRRTPQFYDKCDMCAFKWFRPGDYCTACGRGSNYVSSRPSTVHSSHPGYLAEPSVILNPGRLAMDYRRGPYGRAAYIPRALSHQPSHAHSKPRSAAKRPQKSPVFRYGSSLPEALYDYEVWARKEDRKRMMRRVIGVAFALLAISVIVAAGVVLAAINY